MKNQKYFYKIQRILIYIKHLSITERIQGKLLGNSIKTYWWNGVKNFGDLITPYLLRKLDFTPIHVKHQHAKIILVGSILQRISNDYSGIILGAGLINDMKICFKNARILGLRGAYTKKNLGVKHNIILGDPGLVAVKYFKERQKKKFLLGIVPHFYDKNNYRINQIKEMFPEQITIINVNQGVNAVFKHIDKCSYIISSSLHGLVTADALNIPNAWLKLSKKATGDGFKFLDYYSAFGLRYKPIEITGKETLDSLIANTHNIDKSLVDEVKSDLEKILLRVRQEVQLLDN